MKTETALILLPTKYNPDKKGKRRPIPMKKIQDTAIEITRLFKLGCTIDIYPKYGYWASLKDIISKDVNVILEINRLPKIERAPLIKYCRNNLLDRFKQTAILIKFVPQIQVELVTVKK